MRSWRPFRRPAPTPTALGFDDFDHLDHGGATARGVRSENQDRWATATGWLVVSDGIGGHTGGALAATLTVDAVRQLLERVDGAREPAEALVADAVRRANAAVRAQRAINPRASDMGATVVLGVAASVEAAESRWAVAGVGDSPAWSVTRHGAVQVTADDNVAAGLVRSGAITPEASADHPGRHLLLRAVGIEACLETAAVEVRLGVGDALVLASDGISAVIAPAAIHAVVTAAPSMAEASQRLVDMALRAGTTDNVTVAAVRHVSGSQLPRADETPTPSSVGPNQP